METVLLFHYSKHAEREGRVESVKTENMTGSSDRCDLNFVNPELFSENSSKDDLYCFLKRLLCCQHIKMKHKLCFYLLSMLGVCNML